MTRANPIDLCQFVLPASSPLAAFTVANRLINDDCSICLEALKDKALSDVIELPCRHAFCAECLWDWASRGSLRCPLCQQNFL